MQQLLALGVIDRESRGDMDFAICDLVAIAEDVGSVYADQALAKNIDLELMAASRPVMALVARDLIAEALANLLDNALRYTPAAGRIVVEINARPTTVSVSDSGPGVPEDERQAVFERFVRGRTAVGDGSGLGLAIVSEIASLHGASVTLADSPWGGATVTISLHAAAAVI
jgi:two-component system, OmpR family, sensor histidine kinase TctE